MLESGKHSGSFRDLKALLADCESSRAQQGGTQSEEELPYEIRQRTHLLCSRFLGGAWRNVEVEEIRLTRMKGGMSNMLFLCGLPEGCMPEKKESDKTLLRVYFNPETETHLVAESVIFTLLSERQLGPRLFGIFNGGRLEEYIVSRPLSCPEIRDQKTSREIAQKIARIHQLDVPIAKQPDYIWEALDRWMEHLLIVCETSAFPLHIVVPDRTISLSQEELIAEMELLRWLMQLKRSKPAQHPLLRLTETSAKHLNTSNNNECGKTVLGVSPESRKRLLHACLDINSLYGGPDTEIACAKLDGVLVVDDIELDAQPPPKSARILLLDDLLEEIVLIKKCINKSRSTVMFCHNDLQEGNILLPELAEDGMLNGVPNGEQGQHLVFIDFEYASYNHRGFDFANHFCEWALDYSTDKPPYFTVNWEDYPNVEQQKDFFMSYLESLEGGAKLSDAEKEKEAEHMVSETAPFVPVSHFFWGVWALLQVELSPVEFGFAEYGRQRLALYFQTRQNMLQLLGDEESLVPAILSSTAADTSAVSMSFKKRAIGAGAGGQDKNFLTVN